MTSLWRISHRKWTRVCSFLLQLTVDDMTFPSESQFWDDTSSLLSLAPLMAFHHMSVNTSWPVTLWRHDIKRLPKGQWYATLMFSLLLPWKSYWINSGVTGDLRRHKPYVTSQLKLVNFDLLSSFSWIEWRLHDTCCTTKQRLQTISLKICRWSWAMDEWLHPTVLPGCTYISMY